MVFAGFVLGYGDFCGTLQGSAKNTYAESGACDCFDHAVHLLSDFQRYPEFDKWIRNDFLVSHYGVAFSYIFVIIRGTESCALARILDICLKGVTGTRLLIIFRTLGVTILSVLIGCWIKNMKRWGTEK